MASPNKLKGSLSEFEPKKEEKKEEKGGGGGFDVGQAMNMASSFMYKSPAKNMKTGDYKEKLNVYGRNGLNCNRCQNIIINIKVASRGTHICSHCQKN